MTLHCNVVSHWLGVYTKWSLVQCKWSQHRGPCCVPIEVAFCPHSSGEIPYRLAIDFLGDQCHVGEVGCMLEPLHWDGRDLSSLEGWKAVITTAYRLAVGLLGYRCHARRGGLHVGTVARRWHGFKISGGVVMITAFHPSHHVKAVILIIAVWLKAFCSSVDDTALTLTHWGRDKMAAILQPISSNTFSWIKIYDFWFEFHI